MGGRVTFERFSIRQLCAELLLIVAFYVDVVSGRTSILEAEGEFDYRQRNRVSLFSERPKTATQLLQTVAIETERMVTTSTVRLIFRFVLFYF